MTKATELKFRPSSIQRVLGCPGSALAEAPYPPDPDNKHTLRGRRLHDAMALAFRIGIKGAEEKLTPIWAKMYADAQLGCTKSVEEDLEQVRQAYDAGKLIIPNGGKLAVEYSLDLAHWGLQGGRPDLMVMDEENNAGLIIDWKFGSGDVEDPENNGQLWIYGAALMKMKPQLQSMSLAIVQPGTWKPDKAFREAQFSREDIKAKIGQVQTAIMVAKGPEPVRVAGEHCTWCKARNECATYQALKTGKAEAKAVVVAEKKAAAVEIITRGAPIEVKFDPPLPLTAVVVGEELMGKADEFLALVKSVKVTDTATASTMGQICRNIRGLINDVEEQRKAVKAPYLEACQKIDAAPKDVVARLAEALNLGTAEVTRQIREDEAREKAAQAERDRLAREAAETLAKAQQAEADAIAATAAAELASQQAQEQAQVPQGGLEFTPAPGAALQPPAGIQATAAAELASQQAAVANRVAQEAAAKAHTAVTLANLAPSAAPAAKITGFASKEVVTYEIPDLSKVPADWARQILLPDDKVIQALLKSKKLNEASCAGWMVITRSTVAKATR